MKKALKINISGIIFHIDEDAYEKLKSYLKSIELLFADKQGGKEIIDDIESRIAELFQSRTGPQKQVITIADVDEVTGIMGDPRDFVEDSEDEEPAGATRARPSRRGGRRLYRDPENAILGGVCSGLGSYFAIDPLVIRILFAVLFIAGYGVWGLVYIILWIFIPKAVSISQRLEMRGERVTVSNIEKTVKDEYEAVRENFRKLEKTDGYKQTSSAIGEIFQALGRIVVVIARIVLVLIGVALVFLGFILLMSFLGVFFLESTIFSLGWFSGSIFPLSQFLSAFIDPANLSIILIALFVAVLIPLIMIIYGGIKLIFQIRAKDRGIGIAALVIWIASISVLFTFGVIESRKYAFRGSSTENLMIEEIPSRTLYLKLNENINLTSLEELTWFGGHPQGTVRFHGPRRIFHPQIPATGIYTDPGSGMFWARSSLTIRYTSAGEPEIVVEKNARGSSYLYSELNAENIGYSCEIADSVLIIDHMFTSGQGELWNFAEVNVRLNLPEGYNVHIGDRMNRIITSARTTDGTRISSLTGKKWMMTEEGLQPAD